MRHADLALEAAKAAGRDRWHRYSSSMVHAVRIRHELRSHLMRALDEKTLVVEYQPIVDLATSRPAGFEALVRCLHPTRGMLSPVEFIDIAEESGLIVPIGEHVLTEAARTARSWSDPVGRDRPPYVSVNVSVRQFRSSGFLDAVKLALAQASLPPEQLVLEITESLLLRDDDTVWEDLKRLRDLGIRIAIDDFGTGYSNFAYLRRLPVHTLKLAGPFVDGLRAPGGDSVDEQIVETIIRLAHAIGISVTAEAVETRFQADRLRALGCDTGQGWLFARPLRPADVTDLLRDATPVG